MINCDAARELSNAYIDGALTEADSCAYEEHISCCEVCHEEYDMLKRIAVDLSKTAVPVPEGFSKRMHTALAAEKLKTKNKDKKIFTFPYYRAASVMAAALVIAVVGKFGVYDVYKNVTEDTANIAQELSGQVGGDVQNAVIDVPAPEIATDNQPEVKNQVAPKAKSAPVSPAPSAEDITQYGNGDTIVTEVPEPAVINNDIAYTTDEAEADVTEAAPAEDKNVAMARAIEPYTDETVDENDAEPLTEAEAHKAASGGGSSDLATELVPTEVVIHNSGDGGMIMFKKFLLTILDSSKITETEGVITITLTAEEYPSVIEHIKDNEYVKTVAEGTPFDGKAVINIK